MNLNRWPHQTETESLYLGKLMSEIVRAVINIESTEDSFPEIRFGMT